MSIDKAVHLAAIITDAGSMRLYPQTDFNSWYIEQITLENGTEWELWDSETQHHISTFTYIEAMIKDVEFRFDIELFK